MAHEIFVDTSGFYALLVQRDDKHAEAAQILHAAGTKKRGFVTTDYVLDETATLLKARGPGHKVHNLFETVFASAVCPPNTDDISTTITRAPLRPSSSAADNPAIPAPTTITSVGTPEPAVADLSGSFGEDSWDVSEVSTFVREIGDTLEEHPTHCAPIISVETTCKTDFQFRTHGYVTPKQAPRDCVRVDFDAILHLAVVGLYREVSFSSHCTAG